MPNASHSFAPTASDTQKGVTPIQLLSGNLAHVLTQWMTLIMRDATYLGENLSSGTVTQEHAARILDTTRQVAGLTRRLAAMGKLSQPHVLPGVQILSLSDVVQQATTFVEESCRRRKVELQWKPPAVNALILAEPDLLLTCIVNLFCNALDAMPDGGHLLVDVKADRQSVVLRITDTGQGIAQEHLTKVYEPLFTTRAHLSTTAGLGLTIVRSAMSRWGGKLSIRSREGRGVICRLTLPLSPHASAGHAATQPKIPDTILIVDDQPELRAEIAKALHAAGYETMEAGTAREAVNLVKQNRSKIRLAIVDLVMPDRDGRSVINSIFAISPTTGVIVSSGFCRDYVRSCIHRGPAWGYIQKPFDMPQLHKAVRSCMAEHRNNGSTLTPTLST